VTPTGSNARRVRLIFGALLLVLLLALRALTGTDHVDGRDDRA